MRKHQQRQILELLQTINQTQAVGLYADCQEGAISVGEFIEYIEGEGTQTVSLLEKYCDILYEAYHNSSDARLVKHLKKQLVKVENCVKSELRPNRIEIAFISYKASMSDSIESIYLAAKADPCCDAFFIPVPYYDINPDNSVGTMHYEGTDCYGDNIEITDWRKYDIAARGPDVIFTFNPYDEGNLVTRIHQDFFCRRLRECTDLLIYTPYFVTGGGLKEHFCTTAGCIYAHKVIVQSEKLRDIYISVFQKNFGNRLGNAKDKFVAMGSPKFDKVVNAKRENYKLCDTWRELIGDKKVVFYNTSVSSILQENEQHLKKIRYDFEVFKERGDIALWWRPHPLSQMTFSSMRPQLLTEYERIVAEYCRDGWGIYDDTPDLHRAIAWSDAYFGDVSSVVTLFKAVCKPALYRNAYIDSTIDSITPSLLPMDFKAHDGSAWLYGANINGLFEFDLSESRIALNAFLDKLITGNEISFTDNGALAANLDGTCGEKIYQSLTAQI